MNYPFDYITYNNNKRAAFDTIEGGKYDIILPP